MTPIDGDALRQRLATSPYHVANGITVAAAEPGKVTVVMDVRPEHLNPQGIVHGGVLAGLLDSAVGAALRSVLADDQQQRTVQLQVTYLRAVRDGRLHATGTVVHSGRTVGHAEAEAVDGEGHVVARATAIYAHLTQR